MRTVLLIVSMLTGSMSFAHVNDYFIPSEKIEKGITTNGHIYFLKAIMEIENNNAKETHASHMRLKHLEFSLNGKSFPIPMEKLDVVLPRLDYPWLRYNNGYCVIELPEENGLTPIQIGDCPHTILIRIPSGDSEYCGGDYPRYDMHVLEYDLKGKLLDITKKKACEKEKANDAE